MMFYSYTRCLNLFFFFFISLINFKWILEKEYFFTTKAKPVTWKNGAWQSIDANLVKNMTDKYYRMWLCLCYWVIGVSDQPVISNELSSLLFLNTAWNYFSKSCNTLSQNKILMVGASYMDQMSKGSIRKRFLTF